MPGRTRFGPRIIELTSDCLTRVFGVWRADRCFLVTCGVAYLSPKKTGAGTLSVV